MLLCYKPIRIVPTRFYSNVCFTVIVHFPSSHAKEIFRYMQTLFIWPSQVRSNWKIDKGLLWNQNLDGTWCTGWSSIAPLISQLFQVPLCYKEELFPSILSLLLLCFFITFLFPLTLAPHYERLTLYTTFLNNERRVTLSFSHRVILCLVMANICLLHLCFFFSW
jgi:hypothetical protein